MSTLSVGRSKGHGRDWRDMRMDDVGLDRVVPAAQAKESEDTLKLEAMCETTALSEVLPVSPRIPVKRKYSGFTRHHYVRAGIS